MAHRHYTVILNISDNLFISSLLLVGSFNRSDVEVFADAVGPWAALAIHDTSSVVDATAKYGDTALVVGATVKLTRALWIVPIALGTGAIRGTRARVQWPWFILLFVVVVVLNTYVPSKARIFADLFRLGRIGMILTLYLIGCGGSRAVLTQVGPRPHFQGVLLVDCCGFDFAVA